ncbi:hypothetical protein EHP00_1399 [Ecytonucleospora hepatopenaei]|uniref:RRM domain-containing protein n=1 Tax=Ecytonucleospora hepatopenaei TaxID=646526 RepID=A0A1W0E6C3_9MICR|nr:hypothetical protein EHP00_1399 [Ecytonucleospora hepatopenaei]
MRTTEFIINEKNVIRRKNIREFGIAAIKYNMGRDEINYEPVVFSIYTTEHEEVEDTTVEAFVPSVSLHTDFVPTFDEVSIKVTNIPLRVTKEELITMFHNKNPQEEFKLHLVCEKREEGADYYFKPKSRGFAYISVVDEETAARIIKRMGKVIIDDFQLNMEIVYR